MFNVRWEVRTGSQGRLSIEPTDSEMTLLKGQVQFCLTSGVQRSTYQPNLRVGKPLFCEAWRPVGRPVVCTLLPAEEASGKRTKMSMLTLLVLGAKRGKASLSQPRSETRETDCSEYSTLTSLSFLSIVSNTDNNKQLAMSGLAASP